MIRLIKWLLIIGLIFFIWFSCNFFNNLKDEELDEVKKDAISAIEQGDVNIFAKPLSDKMKNDLRKKKEGVLNGIKNELKEFLRDLFY